MNLRAIYALIVPLLLVAALLPPPAAAGNSAANSTGTVHAGGIGELSFTGLPLLTLGFLGLFVVAGGLAVRRGGR